MGEKVIIRDVSLRDGLQLTKTVVPLQHKVEWFRQLAGAGVSEVELTSFVSRDRLPQFADAIELLAEAKAIGGAKISTLCPSLNMARRGG